MLIARLAIAALASSCIAAQVQAPDLTTQGTVRKPGQITGCVVDVCGKPLPGARVTAVVQDADEVQATCDALGCFAFDGLPLRSCRVRASAAGYRSGLNLVEISTRQPAATARIQLLECDTLQGRVSAADGSPLPGALVVFLAPDKFVGGEPGDHAWTDANGHYRLSEVPIGEVRVTVIARQHAVAEALFVVAGPTTLDFALKPGETASYHIYISGATPEQWSALRCRLRVSPVSSQFGRRHGTDSNYRRWELGQLWPHVREDDSLVYEDLPADLRIEEIVVSVPDGEANPRWLNVAVSAGRHSVTTTIVPDRCRRNAPIVVRGTVRDPQGRPLSGKRITQPPDSATTQVDGSFSLATTTSASGFFSLHLDEEDYVIRAQSLGDHGSYRQREQRSEVAIVADRAARISGTIVDSDRKPVFNAEVSSWLTETSVARLRSPGRRRPATARSLSSAWMRTCS